MANPNPNTAGLKPPWQRGQSGNPRGASAAAERRRWRRLLWQMANDNRADARLAAALRRELDLKPDLPAQVVRLVIEKLEDPNTAIALRAALLLVRMETQNLRLDERAMRLEARAMRIERQAPAQPSRPRIHVPDE